MLRILAVFRLFNGAVVLVVSHVVNSFVFVGCMRIDGLMSVLGLVLATTTKCALDGARPA